MSERMRVYYEREACIKILAEFGLKSTDAKIVECANKILGVKKTFSGQVDKLFEQNKNKVHEDLIWKELKIGRTEMRRVIKSYEEHNIEVIFDGSYYIKK
jgi:hypothetical protein